MMNKKKLNNSDGSGGMKIRIYPDSILRKKAEEITDKNIEGLYQKLVTGMINYGGIGLAAPQIGIDKSIAVVSEKVDEKLEKPLMLVNPKILECSGNQSIEEGCLSVLGINTHVPRAYKIKVETGSANERKIIVAEDLLAIVIQHEIDHLNGILFPDRLQFPKRLWYLFKARLNRRNEKKA
jgi:peptide deformylase